MQAYKLKRGYSADMDRFEQLLREKFGTEIEKKEGKLFTSYGILTEIWVWIENKKMCVDTVSKTEGIDDSQILDANKRFRQFLDHATGYTSKQRVQNAKNEVSK